MMSPNPNTRQFGQALEMYASKHLGKNGLTLLASNYQCRVGEIDLIMLGENQQLVFVEVRYRGSANFGSALESVTAFKQRKIIKTAASFLSKHPQYSCRACRFDVVGISPDESKQGLKIEWVENAFQ